MNKTQTLIVDDPFRAAYLLKFGKYKDSKYKDGKRFYEIEEDGHILFKENYRYRTGSAMVNPLALRESFYLLQELSEETEEEDLFSRIENEEEEETEEIELLEEEDKEELS